MLDLYLITFLLNPIIWYSIFGLIFFHVINTTYMDLGEGLVEYTGMYPNVTFAEYEYNFEWKYDYIEMKDSMTINGHWSLFNLSYFFLEEDYYNEENSINNLKFKLTIKKKIWIDIWEINTKITSLENIPDLTWNMYYKYKISMFNTWHVLEDRILNFFLIIIFFLS